MIQVILLSLLSLICKTASNGNHFIYKEEIVRTDRLCPDLQDSNTAKDIDAANYPYKAVFHLGDPLSSQSDPCIFESNGPRRTITTLVIKAMHLDKNEWNFTGAQNCAENIKLQLPKKSRRFEAILRPLCTVPKPPSTLKNVQGPLYHPSVWKMTKENNMGISFATLIEDKRNKSLAFSMGELPLPKDFPDSTPPQDQFVQIIFATYFGDTCSLRVQQYLFNRIGDSGKNRCKSFSGKSFTLCGMYNCSEEKEILGRVGFWSETLRNQQIAQLVDYVYKKNYRGSPFTKFVLVLLRFLVMPMVFLVACYVTRQLKEKLESRTFRGNMTVFNSHRRGFGNRVDSTVTIDCPTSESGESFNDPPPSYDTLRTLPSYQEATTKVKKASDTQDNVVIHSMNPLPSYSQVVRQEETNPHSSTTNQNLSLSLQRELV